MKPTVEDIEQRIAAWHREAEQIARKKNKRKRRAAEHGHPGVLGNRNPLTNDRRKRRVHWSLRGPIPLVSTRRPKLRATRVASELDVHLPNNKVLLPPNRR